MSRFTETLGIVSDLTALSFYLRGLVLKESSLSANFLKVASLDRLGIFMAEKMHAQASIWADFEECLELFCN